MQCKKGKQLERRCNGVRKQLQPENNNVRENSGKQIWSTRKLNKFGENETVQVSNAQLQQVARTQGVNPVSYCWQIWGEQVGQGFVDAKTLSLEHQVQLVNYVRSYRTVNAPGAQVSLGTGWNISLLNNLATSASDKEVVKYLTFGWPINHDGRQVTISTMNHSSALQYSQHVEQYISKEMEYGCLLGPFLSPPWEQQVGVSPCLHDPKEGHTRDGLSWT